MTGKIDKNKTGLALGVLFGLLHLVWAILVALNIAKPLIDWVLSLHFMVVSYTIMSFSALNAILLILLTFISGYVIGYVLATLWNWMQKYF